MFRSRPTEQDLHGLGLVWEDVAADYAAEVWPDNWPAVEVFDAVADQWRAGPGGVYAIDHTVTFQLFDLFEVPHEQRREVFAAIRVMQSVALEEIRAQKPKPTP